mgnify:CR=1 FL=1
MSTHEQTALINASWNYPTNIQYGPSSIKNLPSLCQSLEINKALIITDEGLKDFDFIQKIKSSLKNSAIFSDVKANPNGKNVSDGVKAYKEGKYQGIVCIGGGSALDAGKAIALMVGQDRPLWDFEDAGDNWTRVNTKGMAPLIAVPTTAGTGSEVGRASVIVDDETDTQQHTKKIIFHANMLPEHVILDPELTTGLPPHITAATGIDAFVHAFEAYCAPGFHPMAEGIALKAMALVKENLPIVFNNGSNIAARGNMLVASTMGATAFQKGLGGVHALAHPLGAMFDKHHGLLNAILLPYVLQANKRAIENKLPELNAMLGIKHDQSKKHFDEFFTWLMGFRSNLGIPNSLLDIGIKLDSEGASRIGKLATLDAASGGNPIPFDAAQYQAIFEHAVNGTLDD